jgi:hypothetical protein
MQCLLINACSLPFYLVYSSILAIYHRPSPPPQFHITQPPSLLLHQTQLTFFLSQSSPRPSSPLPSQREAGTPLGGISSGRPSSPTPPGGPKTAIRRRAAADQKDKVANVRPSSTRAAGAGGSSSTMLSKLFHTFLLGEDVRMWERRYGGHYEA